MGDWRKPWRGCNSGVASICARRSGDAPSRNHERPSSVIATCVWLRGRPWNVPALTSRQFEQAQFHCGNAPPAADPRIFTRITVSLQPGVDSELENVGLQTLFAARNPDLASGNRAIGRVDSHLLAD